jgi:hypothetical protein
MAYVSPSSIIESVRKDTEGGSVSIPPAALVNDDNHRLLREAEAKPYREHQNYEKSHAASGHPEQSARSTGRFDWLG